MFGLRISAGVTVLVVCTVASDAVAQNPKPPTPLQPEIRSVDQLPKDAVTLWIEGSRLKVYIDSTSNQDFQNMLTTIEIKWEGPGPGFVEGNCPDCIWCSDFDVCSANRIAKVRSRGFGPVYDFGDLIPDGYLETWSPETSWIVDGSYFTSGPPFYTLDALDNNAPYFGPVPEPSTLTLLILGIVVLIRTRRH